MFTPDEPGVEVECEEEAGESNQQQQGAEQQQQAVQQQTGAQQQHQQQQQQIGAQQQQTAVQQETGAQKRKAKSKDVNFMGYDKAAMELLPRYVQEQMPLVTTHRGAVDTVLLDLIKVVAISEVGFKGIMDKLKELHCINFYRTMLTYYSVASHLNGPMCKWSIGAHKP